MAASWRPAIQPSVCSTSRATRSARDDEAGVSEVRRRLVDRVAQVVCPEFDEPPVGPQASQRQGGILARQQDQMHERRAVLDEEADESPNRLRRHDVVVVEDQHERLVGGRHGIDKDGPDKVRGCVRSRADQAERRRLCLRSDRPKRGGEVADEPGEVVVGRIERQPGERHAPCREPARDRDGLAVAGRCREQRQARPVLERRVELGTEAGTLSVPGDRGRRTKLGPDQGTRDLRLSD